MPQADPLPANQLGKMLRAMPNPRDRMLLVTLLATGLRISEALSLRVAHVFDADLRPKDFLMVPRTHTKGKIAARTCWLCPEVRNAFQAYLIWLDTEDPADPLFPSRKGSGLSISPRHAARVFLPAFQALAVSGHYTTHSPRKWFARRMHAAMGNDLYATQAALGHRSPTSTTYYLSATQQRIRAAIMKALPDVFEGAAELIARNQEEPK